MTKISKIGIEIEGAWNQNNKPQDLYGDGSVYGFDDETYCDGNCEYYSENGTECDGCQESSSMAIGEIQSPPLNLHDVCLWLDDNYCDNTNHTCGLHVHYTFTDLISYAQLMSKTFNKYFLEQMTLWGKSKNIKNKHFWSRLEGLNHFCAKQFRADRQSKTMNKDGIRYSQINYCYRLRQFHSMEIRLLPCFKESKIAILAVREMTKIIEDYLDRQRKEPKYKKIININPKEVLQSCV